MKSVTFYVIRTKYDSEQRNPNYPSYYEAGWYAAREYFKPFDNAKFFPTEQKAKQYIRNSSTLGQDRDKNLEILPVIVNEPN